MIKLREIKLPGMLAAPHCRGFSMRRQSPLWGQMIDGEVSVPEEPGMSSEVSAEEIRKYKVA